MLGLQVLLAIVPLLGIVWIFASGTLATVDGLFMSLILLTISGVLMLNPTLEARQRLLKAKESRKKAEAPVEQKPQAVKTTVAAQVQKAAETPEPQKTS